MTKDKDLDTQKIDKMEFKLTKPQLREYLKKRFNLDLSNGKIEMVVSHWGIPMEFDRLMTPSMANSYLNKYGPFYYLQGERNSYLGQEQNGEWKFYDKREYLVPLETVYKDVGIPIYLGMKPDELAELYEDEE